MTKITQIYYWLTLAIVYVSLFGLPTMPHKNLHAPQSIGNVTPEQRASHMIEFFDEEKKSLASCTGTAVEDDSILTAEHCDEDHNAAYVRYDAAKELHKIFGGVSDGRDHIIIITGGTKFTNIDPAKFEKVHVIGETVTMYGNEGMTYPAKPRYGKTVDCQDPSDLDQNDEVECFSFTVNPGDSGSAVFNTKGEIVGVLTYKFSDENSDWAEGFGLGHFNTFWLPKDEEVKLKSK